MLTIVSSHTPVVNKGGSRLSSANNSTEPSPARGRPSKRRCPSHELTHSASNIPQQNVAAEWPSTPRFIRSGSASKNVSKYTWIITQVPSSNN